MYDELVKRLRELHPEEFGDAWDFAFACQQAMHEAANAIEELSKRVDESIPRDDAEIIIAEVAKPRWIPVKDRLPEINSGPVIVYVPPYADDDNGDYYHGYVGTANHIDSANGGFWCGTDGNTYGSIGIIRAPTHWMPLPEPPEEE